MLEEPAMCAQGVSAVLSDIVEEGAASEASLLSSSSWSASSCEIVLMMEQIAIK